MSKTEEKKSVYDLVTERIMAQLEKGVVPWRMPWTQGGIAVNWKTQKPYRGVNVWMLGPGEFATYKQVTEAGGHVKKGEKGNLAVFWTWLEDKKDKKAPKIPFLRYYTVFNIATQCEGLQSKRNTQTFEHDPHSKAEEIASNWMDAPDLRFASGRAFYNTVLDFISVPPLKDYKIMDEYYSTLFHEMVHATGHPRRLKREGITAIASFGDETYSKEELVAEMGAAMLCGVAGIDNTLENSAAYINSWMRKIKDEPKLLVNAAAQAQKAADYILGIKFGKEDDADGN